MPILGIKCRVEVAKTFSTAKTISGITRAATAVVTSAAHGFANGDVVLLAITSGMQELNGQAARVANVTANTFDLEGIDSTNYAVFAAGTVRNITAWDTAGDAQSISGQQAQTNWIDVTTLIDEQKQYIAGLPDATNLEVRGLLNPTASATNTVRAASRANSQIPMRVTFASGQVLILNSYASAGDGFEMQAGGVGTTTWSFRQIKNMMWY